GAGRDEWGPESGRPGRGGVVSDGNAGLVERRLPGCAVGFRVCPAACPGVGGTEAEVGPADERAHAQPFREPQNRLVVLQRLVERRRIPMDGDLPEQMMRVRLVTTLAAGHRQLQGFARRLESLP